MDINGPAITLDVELLHLRGVPPGEARRVRAQLERELSRLLAQPGTAQVLGRSRHEARLTPPRRSMPEDGTAGARAARRIHGALTTHR